MIWGAHPYFWKHPYRWFTHCYQRFWQPERWGFMALWDLMALMFPKIHRELEHWNDKINRFSSRPWWEYIVLPLIASRFKGHSSTNTISRRRNYSKFWPNFLVHFHSLRSICDIFQYFRWKLATFGNNQQLPFPSKRIFPFPNHRPSISISKGQSFCSSASIGKRKSWAATVQDVILEIPLGN